MSRNKTKTKSKRKLKTSLKISITQKHDSNTNESCNNITPTAEPITEAEAEENKETDEGKNVEATRVLKSP